MNRQGNDDEEELKYDPQIDVFVRRYFPCSGYAGREGKAPHRSRQAGLISVYDAVDRVSPWRIAIGTRRPCA